MSSLDLADELEARAAALRAEGRLEADLEAAYQAYTADPSVETKAAHQAASVALREARRARRSDRVVVSGDAFVDNGEV